MLDIGVYMFAVYLGFIFVSMTALMCFIFYIARAAISAIANITGSSTESARTSGTFIPQKMKKLFSEPDSIEAERLRKEKEMKTNQRLACISGVTVTLIALMSCMCVQGITSGIRYSHIKSFIVVGSLYAALNPLIYLSTMAEVRFFLKKDFYDWKDKNAISLSLVKRRTRRVASAYMDNK